MNILVQVHINNDWDDSGVQCAKISLDEAGIKRIFRLAQKAGEQHTIQEFDYTPDFGTSELDLDNMDGHYWDIDKLAETNPLPEGVDQQKVFASLEDVRIDVSQLNVDHHDFWWEGCFKHTDVRWTTNLIPLDFLPQEFRQSGSKATTPPAQSADLNMTAEQMNAIHEKIAAGMAHGLNAREIVATFNKKVTLAQLVRVIMEHIERDH